MRSSRVRTCSSLRRQEGRAGEGRKRPGERETATNHMTRRKGLHSGRPTSAMQTAGNHALLVAAPSCRLPCARASRSLPAHLRSEFCSATASAS